MPTCILCIRDILSPISGTARGKRVLVAIPNVAARTQFGKPIPSFDKPFLLAIFGDYCDDADVLANIRKIHVVVKRMGFTRIDLV